MTRMKLALTVAAAFLLGVTVTPVASFAVTYFSVTKVVTGTGTAYCPSGYRVTGGGVNIPANRYTSTSSTVYGLQYSRPTVSGTAWTGSLSVEHGTYSSSSGWHYTSYGQSAGVYAVCVH